MKTLMTFSLLLCGTLLGACDRTGAQDQGSSNASAGGGRGSENPNALPAKSATGKGRVAAIDVAGGRITLDHEPIPAAGWPAMTMAFDVRPELVGGLSVGDAVGFTLALEDGGGEVTAIRKQP